MSERKKEQSMRLFEALGNIDAELLERSEKQKKTVPFRRYGSLAAAVLVFAAVGGVSLYAMQFSGKMEATDEAHFAIMPEQQSIKTDQYAGGLLECAEDEDVEQKQASVSGAAGAAKEEKSDQVSGGEVLADLESMRPEENGAEIEAVGAGGQPTLEELAGERKMGTLTEYLPAQIPAGYLLCEVEISAEGDHFRIVLEGEDGTRLSYQAYSPGQSGELCSGKAICLDAGELSEELLKAELEKDRGTDPEETVIAVWYGDGVSVRISGTNRAQLLWELIPQK